VYKAAALFTKTKILVELFENECLKSTFMKQICLLATPVSGVVLYGMLFIFAYGRSCYY
jgi:ABC-type iron transport system FetAB ATPase subunit